MTKIQISLIDMAGNISLLPLPDDKPLTQLIPSLVTLLDLTETDVEGRLLDYRLFSRRLQRVLGYEGSLYSNGVLEDDQLRILPAPFTEKLELVMMSEPEPGTRLVLEPRARITIGRGSDNDIIIRHVAVSRNHGEFTWQDGLHIYRDLGSANGSTLNNQIVSEPIPISVGSILTLSDTVRMRYQEAKSDELEWLAPPRPQVILDEAEGTASSLNTDRLRTTLSPLPRGSVFISYAPEQADIAEHLASQLRRSNFQIFWDKEIPPGSNADEAISSGLRLADAMVTILSPEAILSQTLAQQWNFFMLNRKPIVPVIYEECVLPRTLQEFTPIRHMGSFNRMVNDIVVALFRAMRS
ncbi:MAG: TIR domain-containing protein [Chloroflexi bacterium]|nr:TIR domain-containing protein [Chloroflexota bacterium]